MPPWTIRARESAHYVTLTRGRQGRLRASILALACALVASFCAVGPASALDPPLGRALEEIGAPLGRFGDGPLWALLHGAALEASEADVSLAALPDPEVRLAAGPITAGDIARVFPSDDSLEVVVLTGRELRETLERAAHGLATYDYQDRRPLAGPDFAGPRFVAAAGVSYEIDLTRPAGDRIVHLSWRGTPLAPEQRLRVVLDQSLRGAGSAYAALQAAPRAPDAARALRDVLADYVRRHGVLTAAFQRGWTLLPDYASTPERPLIDRLVRLGAAPPAEVQRLAPDQVARRGDFAYWLARAYGWRETRLSGAYPDVPDSLRERLEARDDLCETLSRLAHDAEKFEQRHQAVARERKVRENDVPRRLAAEIRARAKHLLEDVLVADRRPLQADAAAAEGQFQPEV